MLGPARMLVTIAAFALPMPAAAQAPAPAPTTTAFDGVYFGSRTLEEAYEGKSWVHFCLTTRTIAPLTIVNGIAGTQWGGTTEGSVSPQGVLVMRAPLGQRFDGQIDSQGTIRGRMNSGFCSYQLVWQKAPASTTAFDGKYVGVWRESSKTATPDGVPAPLSITYGVVLSKWGWRGTVSPQGAVVIGNPVFPRVDAQIDPRGTIRGQTSGSDCFTTFVWRKQPG
jgi:hypothetical protein